MQANAAMEIDNANEKVFKQKDKAGSGRNGNGQMVINFCDEKRKRKDNIEKTEGKSVCSCWSTSL